MNTEGRRKAWANVIKVLYGGTGPRPESDADQLRQIADLFDRVDDAADIALDGRHQVDRELQEDIRRIADVLDGKEVPT